MGGVVGNLKVARLGTDFLSLDQIGELVRNLDEFVIVDSDVKEEHPWEFPETVLVTEFRCHHPWQRGEFFSWGGWIGQSIDSGLPESIGKVAASSWGRSWKDVAGWSELDVSVFGGDLDVRYSWIRRAPEADV